MNIKLRIHQLLILGCIFFISGINIKDANAGEYDIYVKNKRVTDDNKNDILGDGKVSFDPFSLTLTLNNARIDTANNAYCIQIWNTHSEYTIALKGHSTLSSTDVPAIYSSAFTSLHIIGTGTATISSQTYAIAVEKDLFLDDNVNITASTNAKNAVSTGKGVTLRNNARLIASSQNDIAVRTDAGVTIKDNAYLDAYGKKYGIEAESVTIDGCAIKASCSDNSGEAINCKNLNITNCHISKPVNATVSDNKITEYGENVQSIETSTVFNLYIKNTQVTESNKNNILGDGKVSYDGKTLTLNNASMNVGANRYHTIYFGNGLKNPILKINGNNTIKGTTDGSFSAIYCYNDSLTITGSDTDTLFAESSTEYGIAANKLIIEGGCVVNAIGRNNAIANIFAPDTLHIKGSSLYAKASSPSGYAIGYKYIELKNCEILDPANAVNKMGTGIVDNKNNLVNSVTITEAYGIHINGTRITNVNKHDVFGDGTISFEPTTETLTLDNATIDAGSNSYNAIKFDSTLSNPIINLIGYNEVKSASEEIYPTILSDATLNITGSKASTLSIESTFRDAIRANKDLNITGGCSVSSTGKYFGIYNHFTDYKLTVNNSNLSVKTTSGIDGCIEYQYISLKNCHIEYPQEAVIVDGVGIRVNDDVVPEVIIKQGNTANEMFAQNKIWANKGTLFINSNSSSYAYIYSISGKLVRTSLLHEGINEIIELENDIYIVTTGGVSTKVFICK